MRGRQGALNAKFDGTVLFFLFFLELYEKYYENILGDVVNGKWSPEFAGHSHQIEML